MIVNPKAITFFGNNIEAHVDVTNGGNNTFIFSVDGLPDGFTLHPMSHELQKGDTLPLVIIRSLVPLELAVVQSSARSPFKFRVRTNLNDQEEVANRDRSEERRCLEELGRSSKERVWQGFFRDFCQRCPSYR